MKTISPEAVRNHLRDGEPLNLLEALAMDEFDKEHLPGVLRLMPDEVLALVPGLIPDRGHLIVLFCEVGRCQATQNATDDLLSLGYTNIAKYEGSPQDWASAGRSLERRSCSPLGKRQSIPVCTCCFR